MDRLHFERRELKYLVPEEQTAEFRRFIEPYVRIDDYAAGAPRNRYAIHNVYLETPRRDFYRACLDGSHDRVKLRIRWYDAEARGPFFLEVKHKVRGVIIKDRAVATREEVEQVLRGEIPAAASTMDRGDWRLFLDRLHTTGARPYMRVRYTREPYESVFGEYARVTFDRAVCYQAIDDFLGGVHPLDEDDRAWSYVDGTWATKEVPRACILELKTTAGTAPRWMSDLVAHFGLKETGYSKYANSVAHHLGGDTTEYDSDLVATAWSRRVF